MKKLMIPAIVFMIVLFAAFPIFACEMDFTLVSNGGEAETITPGKTVTLDKDEVYTLSVTFTPDHGRCLLEPEDTVYLLEDERWKETKDYLPVVLLQSSEWDLLEGGSAEQTLTLTGAETGKWDLEVIRDCTKGGYDEVITFKVK